MLYKKEFGLDFELGFSLQELPFLVDKSWHNDTCVSFYFMAKEQYYILWVDYPDKNERENSGLRYTIEKGTNEGSHAHPEIYSQDEIVFESEKFSDSLKVILMLFNSR